MDPELLEIIRLGHPVLRQVAEPVPEQLLDSTELNQLGERMIRTMLEANGVGLAAPQVAEPLRLFAFWLPADEEHPGIEPTVLVNPEVRAVSSELESGWEGCLSIPGLRGLVPRSPRVKVRALTLGGDPVSFTADGFHARVIQHELDHLDGVVFLDRMTSMDSLAFEPEWERFVAVPADE